MVPMRCGMEIVGQTHIKTGMKPLSRKGWGCLETLLNLFWAKFKTLSWKSPLSWSLTLVHLLPSWLYVYTDQHTGAHFWPLEISVVGKSTTNIIFQDVCKAIVECLCKRFVYLPINLQGRSQELECFLASWDFPCVGAWDGFHIYISTKLKNFYSYKKMYTVTNMGFIG